MRRTSWCTIIHFTALAFLLFPSQTLSKTRDQGTGIYELGEIVVSGEKFTGVESVGTVRENSPGISSAASRTPFAPPRWDTSRIFASRPHRLYCDPPPCAATKSHGVSDTKTCTSSTASSRRGWAFLQASFANPSCSRPTIPIAAHAMQIRSDHEPVRRSLGRAVAGWIIPTVAMRRLVLHRAAEESTSLPPRPPASEPRKSFEMMNQNTTPMRP